MGLRLKIVALVAMLVSAGIWGLAVSVVAVQRENLEKLISDQLSATVDNTADDLDRVIQLRIDALAKVAALITPEILADAQRLQGALEEGAAASVLFPFGIFAADVHGTIIADFPKQLMRKGASVKDRQYFRAAMAGGKPVVGSPIMGQLVRPAPVVSIGVPLHYHGGAAKAVLVSPIPLSDPMMVGQLEQTKIGQTGYFLVLAPKERLIVSASDRSRILKTLPPLGERPLLDQQLQSESKVTGIAKSLLGAEILTVSRRMSTTGWVVIGAVPTQEIFAPIASLKTHIYLAALVLSLAIAAILRFVLARLLAPLDQAREAIRVMTRGEQPLEAIPVAREDEIGRLIGSFNDLALERNRLEFALKGEIVVQQQAGDALNQALARLQALCEHMTKAQEEERRKLAVELHEQAAQELATLRMHLQLMDARCADGDARTELQNSIAIAEAALERIRTLSLDLRPPVLDDFGLRTALHRYCEAQAEKTGWIIHFHASELPERPHRDVEVACFRMAQQALNNIAQHAGASEVWVSLYRRNEALHLSLRDNGVGFDAEAIDAGPEPERLGLQAMIERVRQVGGHAHVRSNHGRGTEVHARFPLADDAGHSAPGAAETTSMDPIRLGLAASL